MHARLAALFVASGLLSWSAMADPLLSGKPAIEVLPIERTTITLPDGTTRELGEDFRMRLEDRAQASNLFVVTSPVSPFSERSLLDADRTTHALGDEFGGPVWSSSVPPATTVEIELKAFSFQVGSRATRTFYGFNEKIPARFAGNSFPLYKDAIRASFGPRFDVVGKPPLDSQSGLDIGSGFSLSLIFTKLAVHYEKYRARLAFLVRFRDPRGKMLYAERIAVGGDGRYWDFSLGYKGISLEMQSARRDAMLKAFDRGVARAFDHMARKHSELPRWARLDAILEGSRFLLGTGPNSEVLPGTLYTEINPEDPSDPIVLEVEETVSSGSIAVLAQATSLERLARLAPGATFAQGEPEGAGALDRTLAASATTMAAATAVTLDADPIETAKPKSKSTIRFSLFGWLRDLLSLPYRLWRYKQYDQDFEREARTKTLAVHPYEWFHIKPQEGYSDDFPQKPSKADRWAAGGWLESLGIDIKERFLYTRATRIALIDSGVDYNHPWLHSAFEKDELGYDFISGDNRPFDDSYAGTRVASTLHDIAPRTQIISLKVFSPYGVTTDNAIAGAFDEAIRQQVDLILVPWATTVPSAALRAGVELANVHGVPVITSAGDELRDIETAPVFPAAWSRELPNIFVATRLNTKSDWGRKLASGFSPNFVHIGVPTTAIEVASPRNRFTRTSGSDLAAGALAGAIARVIETGAAGDGLEAARSVLGECISKPSLMLRVSGGCVLSR